MIDFEAFKANSSWAQMSEPDKLSFIEYINREGLPAEKAALAYNWIDIWSRSEQVPYMYTDLDSWNVWAYIAGRSKDAEKLGQAQSLFVIWYLLLSLEHLFVLVV